MIEMNKIYNEDCIKTMSKMPNNFIDLVVTSPPYDDMRTYKNNVGLKWSDKIWKPIIKELFMVVNIGGVVVWIVGDKTENGSETGTSFKQALYFKECGFNLHDTMIYSKNKAPINCKRYQCGFEYMFIFCKGKIKTFNPIKEKSIKFGNSQTSGQRSKNGVIKKRHNGKSFVKQFKTKKNIWHYYVGNGEGDKISQNHPARFPEKLAADHIKSWSNENDLIYDCFAGSGTTFKMSHLLKRRFIGSEISAEYCEIANKRVNPYLDQKTLF
jgi:site-specific DNA-methyltransferase (adenine-specific)